MICRTPMLPLMMPLNREHSFATCCGRQICETSRRLVWRMSVPGRCCLLLFWVMLTSGCTTHEVGEIVYHAMEHVRCYDQFRSHGQCNQPQGASQADPSNEFLASRLKLHSSRSVATRLRRLERSDMPMRVLAKMEHGAHRRNQRRCQRQ